MTPTEEEPPPPPLPSSKSPKVVVLPKGSSWIRIPLPRYSRWEWSGSKLELGAGASAALTVCTVYVCLIFCFVVALLLTVPRNLTQVYNITLSSDNYRAHVKLEIQRTYEPLEVAMTCHPTVAAAAQSRTVHVFFDMNERLVIYNDIRKNVCYVRSTSGEQYQQEAQIFKTLLLGTSTLPSGSKPTVHYTLLPTTKRQRETLLAPRQKDFCSSAKIYWLSYFTSEGSDEDTNELDFLRRTEAKRKRTYQMTYVDACLETLVIHRLKGRFLL